MRYAHIIGEVYDTPLAITPEKAEEWDRVIAQHMTGAAPAYTQAEVQAAHEARLQAFAASAGAQPTRAGYALTDSGIAVIPVHGSLVHRGGLMEAMSGVTGYNQLRAQMRAAEADSNVRGILFDVDSPGGHVSGMFETAEQIRALNKPTRAMVNDKATSAAYMLASAADSVHATKTAFLGHIGSFVMHADRSKQHDKQGVKWTPIYSGKRKLEGNPFGPLTSDARAALQDRVDEVRGMMAEMVAAHRGVDADDVMDTEAAVVTAGEAERLGLIDGTATLAQSITDFAAQLDNDEQQASAAELMRTSGKARASAPTTKGSSEMDKKDDKAPAQPTQPAAAAITPEQAQASADTAAAAARTAERARVKAIMSHAEAAGREALAAHLAHDTDLSADAAIGILTNAEKKAAAPAEAPKQRNALADAMAKEGNPDVSADATTTVDATEETVAASISQFFPGRRKAAA